MYEGEILAAPQDSLEFDHDPDHELCTCEFRPYKDPHNPNAWALQRAMALRFEQFLDKAYTCAKWSGGIDLKLGTWKFGDPVLRSQQESLRRKMEKYAVNDVLSVLYIFQQKQQHLKKKTKSSTADPELVRQSKEQHTTLAKLFITRSKVLFYSLLAAALLWMIPINLPGGMRNKLCIFLITVGIAAACEMYEIHKKMAEWKN
ncbi:unnamed protein product [Didymodactylos carnosus]|uniref:Uncharacterized protein n=1 Tax=Didymodactylos carnosus TaxID=1234261 RepID=A0A8S2EBE5_9BILA|nr:unnamed protein product [Didymodactylos carnosus]CAF3905735.1 unnamed protein product [Didymodactylos carnosus]